ncbi:MAG: discoidin domain-containing protein [Prevotella sp.]|nr:discoidin domain-containing protein [Prevotella sp.]
MKTICKITAMLAVALLMVSCGESLEDTYKDYSGDGTSIRYTGRCRNISVTGGWQRMVLNWTNNVDPIIKNVKIVWKYEDEADSVYLPAGTTEYSIDHIGSEPLGDRSFEITICSVSEQGVESLSNTVYGRPYTYTHEEVQAFNRLVSSAYKIRDRVILTFLPWQEGISAAHLTYTKKDGSQGYLELTPEQVAMNYYMLEDEVDNDKPIVVHRTAKLETCVDEIEFLPYEFDDTRIFNSDFLEDLRRQFGFEEIPEDWIERQTVLYLDALSYNSFIDLLNFPNLKKVVLGSRRYFPESEVDDEEYAQDIVMDVEESNFALQVLHELNGLTVERYNNHFPQLEVKDFFTEKGQPVEPKKRLIDLTGKTFKVSPEDEMGFNSHLPNLTDGDPSTFWQPRLTGEAYQYELSIDLGEVKAVSGVKIVQRMWENEQEHMVAPKSCRVLLSENGAEWGYATYLESYPLGAANGEVNYIDFPFTFGARYVMVVVPSGFYFTLNFTSIAEISLY